MKLKIMNNVIVLGLVLTVMMTFGCSRIMSVKPGVNLSDYDVIAVAKGDFECRFEAPLGSGTWSIKRGDKFGVIDIQNMPLYMGDSRFGKADKFPHDSVGIDLGDQWITPLYPDGSLASDLVYACFVHGEYKCLYAGHGGCKPLEGGNFEMINR